MFYISMYWLQLDSCLCTRLVFHFHCYFYSFRLRSFTLISDHILNSIYKKIFSLILCSGEGWWGLCVCFFAIQYYQNVTNLFVVFFFGDWTVYYTGNIGMKKQLCALKHILILAIQAIDILNFVCDIISREFGEFLFICWVSATLDNCKIKWKLLPKNVIVQKMQ